MTGIARRTDWPIASVRLGIELSVLVIGFLLGGRAGIGTVLFALTIGYAVAASINALAKIALRETSRARSSADTTERAERGDARPAEEH